MNAPTATATLAIPAAVEQLAIAAIKPSPSNPRKRFDAKYLAELAESIKQHGVLQPITVRPRFTVRVSKSDVGEQWYAEVLNLAGGWNVQDGAHPTEAAAKAAAGKIAAEYEIVMGECRWRASQLAGVSHIPAIVRAIPDADVLELQITENLQRNDLDPLEEAEGYRELMRLKGINANALAELLGKSRSYVYTRTKLADLCPEAKKAITDGKLDGSRALLIARIGHHDTQRAALKEILEPRFFNADNEPLSYRAARDHIARNYMLALKDAPFDTKDATLLPKAGACAACPKRTGNAPDLFADIKGPDACTDPRCFGLKREAHAERLRFAAEAAGKMVIAGAEAKKIAPYGASSSLSGYTRLTDHIWNGKREVKVYALVGKDAEPELLQDPKTGDIVEIVSDAVIRKALKAKGLDAAAAGSGNDDYRATQKRQEQKAKAERGVRAAILDAVRAKIGEREFDRADLIMIAESSYERALFDGQAMIAKLWKWTDKRGDVRDCRKRIAGLSSPELRRLLVDLALIGDTQVHSYAMGSAAALLSAAKRYKVDAEKIRRDLTAAAKAKPKATAAPARKRKLK